MTFLFFDSTASVDIPILPTIHPAFYKRDLFPLVLSESFTWWFQQTPPAYQCYYQEHVDDFIKLEKYFLFAWNYILKWPFHNGSFQTSNKPRMFHLVVHAAAFGSFINKMKEYTTATGGAFILPFSGICCAKPLTSHMIDPIYSTQPTIDHFHRHLLVVVRDGSDFLEQCYTNIHANGSFDRSLKTFREMKTVPNTFIEELIYECPFTYEDSEVNDCTNRLIDLNV